MWKEAPENPNRGKEAGAKKGTKNTKSANNGKSSFPPGIEFEILQADAIVLQGLVYAIR